MQESQESRVVQINEARMKFVRGLINREEMNFSVASVLMHGALEQGVERMDPVARAVIAALISTNE